MSFNIRCILCDVYSTDGVTIIHVDTFYGTKEDSYVAFKQAPLNFEFRKK